MYDMSTIHANLNGTDFRLSRERRNETHRKHTGVSMKSSVYVQKINASYRMNTNAMIATLTTIIF